MWSSVEHMATFPVHFEYEYFNNQATWPELGQNIEQDRDQSSGTEMTETGTGTGPCPKTFSGFNQIGWYLFHFLWEI